jgi:hypothetical protein
MNKDIEQSKLGLINYKELIEILKLHICIKKLKENDHNVIILRAPNLERPIFIKELIKRSHELLLLEAPNERPNAFMKELITQCNLTKPDIALLMEMARVHSSAEISKQKALRAQTRHDVKHILKTRSNHKKSFRNNF